MNDERQHNALSALEILFMAARAGLGFYNRGDDATERADGGGKSGVRNDASNADTARMQRRANQLRDLIRTEQRTEQKRELERELRDIEEELG